MFGAERHECAQVLLQLWGRLPATPLSMTQDRGRELARRATSQLKPASRVERTPAPGWETASAIPLDAGADFCRRDAPWAGRRSLRRRLQRAIRPLPDGRIVQRVVFASGAKVALPPGLVIGHDLHRLAAHRARLPDRIQRRLRNSPAPASLALRHARTQADCRRLPASGRCRCALAA